MSHICHLFSRMRQLKACMRATDTMFHQWSYLCMEKCSSVFEICFLSMYGFSSFMFLWLQEVGAVPGVLAILKAERKREMAYVNVCILFYEETQIFPRNSRQIYLSHLPASLNGYFCLQGLGTQLPQIKSVFYYLGGKSIEKAINDV